MRFDVPPSTNFTQRPLTVGGGLTAYCRSMRSIRSWIGSPGESRRIRRTQLPPDERLAQDRSLQIFAAPGIFREVKTIHESIQQNLAADPTLMQTDIAVLVPDINTYKPAAKCIESSMKQNYWQNSNSTQAVYFPSVFQGFPHIS